MEELYTIFQGGIDDLAGLDIFKRIDGHFAPGAETPSPNAPVPVRVQVALEEKKQHALTIRTSTTADLETQLQVKGLWRNVFGRAERLSGSLRSSPRNSTEFSAAFLKPLLAFGYGTSVEVSAFKQSSSYAQASSFDEEARGVVATLRHGLHSVSAEWAWRDIAVRKGASAAILAEGGPNVKSALRYRWEEDTRDDSVTPVNGTLRHVTMEGAGLGGYAAAFPPFSSCLFLVSSPSYFHFSSLLSSP